MRIGLLTTIWKRHDLGRITLKHHAGLDIPGIEIVPVAVGSEGAASRRLAKRAGWLYVEAPNRPLSNKHNAGLRALSTAGVDGVVVIGSDNLLNAAYFEYAASLLAQGREFMEMRGIWFYDLPGDELTYAGQWSTGVGHCMASSILRRRDWKAWDDGHDRYLDRLVTKRIASHAHPRSWISDLRKTDVRAVDIKTADNMWGYDWCVNEVCRADRRHPVNNPRSWFDRHFPGVFDDLAEITRPATEEEIPQPQAA